MSCHFFINGCYNFRTRSLMSYLKVTKHVLTDVSAQLPLECKERADENWTLPKLKSLSVSHDPLLRTGLMGTE